MKSNVLHIQLIKFEWNGFLSGNRHFSHFGRHLDPVKMNSRFYHEKNSNNENPDILDSIGHLCRLSAIGYEMKMFAILKILFL